VSLGGALSVRATAATVAARASADPLRTCGPPCRTSSLSSDRKALPLRARAMMSVAARSPFQCPAGSATIGASACASVSSSSPRAMPMHAEGW
jgi:hypothetical protein